MGEDLAKDITRKIDEGSRCVQDDCGEAEPEDVLSELWSGEQEGESDILEF